MKPIRLAIADDYAVFRDGLKAILSGDETVEVVAEADNGAELLEQLARVEVDVIFMDLKMPVMGGMEATRKVRELYPHIKVLVISMYEDQRFITHLVEIGANGYLLKNAEPDDIRMAILAVMENGYFFNEPIDNKLLKQLISHNNLAPVFREGDPLTADELELLRVLATNPRHAGAGNAALHALMEKTGVRNVAGLVMYAVVKGLAGD